MVLINTSRQSQQTPSGPDHVTSPLAHHMAEEPHTVSTPSPHDRRVRDPHIGSIDPHIGPGRADPSYLYFFFFAMTSCRGPATPVRSAGVWRNRRVKSCSVLSQRRKLCGHFGEFCVRNQWINRTWDEILQNVCLSLYSLYQHGS